MGSEETSEVRAARLEGMRQHVQTVCGDETSEADVLAKARPPDVYITLITLGAHARVL